MSIGKECKDALSGKHNAAMSGTPPHPATLADLLGAPAEWEPAKAHARFDRWMLAVNAVLVAAHARAATVPAGIGGRIARALERPSSGGLRDLAAFLSKSVPKGSATALARLIVQEAPETGWLGRFIVLRNRVYHNPDSPEALAELARHLAKAPAFDLLGCFDTDAAGEAHWLGPDESTDKPIPLGPLFQCRDGEYVWWEGLTPDGALRPSDGSLAGPDRWRLMWQELRARDPALDDPTPADFAAKARRLEGERPPPTTDAWWAAEQLFHSTEAPHFLVDPLILGQSLPGDRRIDLGADLLATQPPGEALAVHLGLAEPVRISPLLRFCEALDGNTLLTLDATRVDAWAFLRILFWLTDLADDLRQEDAKPAPLWPALRDLVSSEKAPDPKTTPPPCHLAVLVARSEAALRKDDETLFERLPTGLDKVLRLPPHATHLRLFDFIWTESNPKRNPLHLLLGS